MAKLISIYKDGTLSYKKRCIFFFCKSIIGQQISVAAANSVFFKFKKNVKER